jgi:hypothetical protein
MELIEIVIKMLGSIATFGTWNFVVVSITALLVYGGYNTINFLKEKYSAKDDPQIKALENILDEINDIEKQVAVLGADKEIYKDEFRKINDKLDNIALRLSLIHETCKKHDGKTFRD